MITLPSWRLLGGQFTGRTSIFIVFKPFENNEGRDAKFKIKQFSNLYIIPCQNIFISWGEKNKDVGAHMHQNLLLTSQLPKGKSQFVLQRRFFPGETVPAPEDGV